MDWASRFAEVATGPVPALVLALLMLVVALYVVRRLYADLARERERRDALQERMEGLLRETRAVLTRRERDGAGS